MKFQTRSLPRTPWTAAEPLPLISSRRSSVPAGRGARRFGRRILNAALTNDIETHLAGSADHQLTAHWHCHRRCRLRAFARAQSQEHYRRPPGINRRSDPRVDTEIRRSNHAMPIESGGNAFYSLTASGKETRHHKNDHQRAKCHRVAQRQSRRRPAGFELACRQQRALDVRSARAPGTRDPDYWRQCGPRLWWPDDAFHRCCDQAGADRRKRWAAAKLTKATPLPRSRSGK